MNTRNILPIIGAVMISTQAFSQSGVEEISIDCGMAIAVVVDQMVSDGLFARTKLETLTVLRKNYRKILCTADNDYLNIEVILDSSDRARGGLVYFRLNRQTFEIVEKSKD